MDDRLELIVNSSFFDEKWYLDRCGNLGSCKTAAEHYLFVGWKKGLPPGPKFDGQKYLHVNNDVAKAKVCPLVHFEKYGKKEGRKGFLRDSSSLPIPPIVQRCNNVSKQGAATNSSVGKGESSGEEGFSAQGYLALYPDIVKAKINPYEHYQRHGKAEGRSNGLYAPLKYGGGPLSSVFEEGLAYDKSKKSCILVSHESSRTGSPINTWSMCRCLARKYNVLVISLTSGPLDDLFRLDSWKYVVFDSMVRFNADYLDFVLSEVLSSEPFEFAIVNSVVSSVILRVLTPKRIPTIACIHDAAPYCSLHALKDMCLYSSVTVFSSNFLRDGAAKKLGVETLDLPVINQGQSYVPVMNNDQMSEREFFYYNRLKSQKTSNGEFFVLGVGTVEYRKGFDLFIRTAAEIKRKSPSRKFKFIWVGGGYNPSSDGYSKMCEAQIHALGLDDEFVYTGSVKFINKFFALADLFLLTSILDPLPGVVIEAISFGVPVLCFDKSSGFPEMFSADGIAEKCVAPHLDVSAMSDMAVNLVLDDAQRGALLKSQREFHHRHFNMQEYVDRLSALVPDVQHQMDEMKRTIGCAEKGRWILGFRASRARSLGIPDSSITIRSAMRYNELCPVVFGLKESVPDADLLSVDDQCCAVGGNTGNLAFHYAINRAVEIFPKVFDWNCREPMPEGSVGIIPCANQLGPHCDMTTDAVEWVNSRSFPFVAIGLGAQSMLKIGAGALDYELPYIHPRTEEWVRSIAEHSVTGAPNISVRGEFTMRVMERLGLKGRAVALGCPSLFMNPAEDLGSRIASNYKGIKRVAMAAGQTGWRLLEGLENSLAKIITECDGALVVQAARVEMKAVSGEFSDLSTNERKILNSHFRADLCEQDFAKWFKAYGRIFFDISKWMEFYRQFDFVVGPRIHGVMIALQAGVPAMCIAIDSRTTELCEIMKVPYVSFNSVKDGVTLDDLNRLFKFDPVEFDKNRRMLASGFVRFLKNNKITPAVDLINIAGT